MMKDTAVWMHSQGRGFVDLIDHFIVGTSGSSFPSYLSLAAAGAVTMGLGYYLTKNNNDGKINPLVDPLNQTVKQK
ncbi:hypothetical protein ANCCAN_29070, partial [Ancylostoma caninum]